MRRALAAATTFALVAALVGIASPPPAAADPGPRLTVNPDGGWVSGQGFAAYATATFTRNGELIDGGPAAFDSFGNTWFQVDLDIVQGDLIGLGDGTVTKTLTVTGLSVTGITGTTVSGTASGSAVHLWVNGVNVTRTVPVTGGTWATDVSQPGLQPGDQGTVPALDPGANGGVQESDTDGDATHADWWVPRPRFTVDPENQWVEGFEFAPNADIEITRNGTRIDDGTITADGEGYFWWDSPEPLPVGATITVDDGVGPKTHVVTDVAIESVVGSVVSGRASGEWVDLWVDRWGEAGCNRNVMVSGGAWSEDLAPCALLGPGSELGVEETDEDGDGTQANWRIPDPSFAAVLTDNRIKGEEFGAPVTITITDGARTQTYAGDLIEYWDDGFDLYLDWVPEDHAWTLGPGQTITVVGPSGTTKSLLVADLRIEGWDYGTEQIWGTTNQAGDVTAEAMHPDKEYDSFMVSPDASGRWEIGLIDIRIMDEGKVWQFDEDGDRTTLWLTLGPTRFLFSPLFQQIVGSDWVNGSTVTLTVENPATPATPDFTATQVAAPLDCSVRGACPNWRLPLTGEVNVFFDLNDTGFQARAGDTITMSDGTTTKTLVVPSLEVTSSDPVANTVSGTTSVPMPGFLAVGLDPDVCGERHETVPDPVGGWTVSFFEDCQVQSPFEGVALETDAEGDQTWTIAPMVDLRVDPAADRIWAAWWAPADVTLTIERDGSPDFTWPSIRTTNVLTRGSWNIDMWAQPVGTLDAPMEALWDLAGAFDIRAGDVITVTDGTLTRSTTVAALTVDSIDAAADTVSGTAAPGQRVSFHLDDGEEGYWGYETFADAAGAWTFHFDPNEFPGQGLDPGMLGQTFGPDNVTVIRWTVPAGIATATRVVGDAPDPSVVGQSYLVRVNVQRTGAGSGRPLGTVTIADGSGASCTDTTSTMVDARTSAFSCALRSTTAGAKTLAATFNPAAGWAGSTDSAAHEVRRAATVTTITNAAALASKVTRVDEAYSVAVKVAVLGPGSGVPTGSVVVSDGSATCTVATLSASGAGSCQLTSTSAGLKTITARYAGTPDFGPSAATVKHRVR